MVPTSPPTSHCTPSSLQVLRPVLLNATALWLPYPKSGVSMRGVPSWTWSAGDSRLALFATLQDLAGQGARQQSENLAGPTGLLMTVNSVTWSFAGCEIGLLNASIAPGVSAAAKNCTVATAHLFSITTTAGLAIDARKLINAGSVYRVAATANITVTPLWGAGPLLGAGAASLVPSELTAVGGASPSAVKAYQAVADLSARVSRRRPTIAGNATLVALPASAALLLTHLPPYAGFVAAFPNTVRALAPARVSSSSWMSWADVCAEAAVLGASPSVSRDAVAAWIQSTVPLNDAQVCSVAELPASPALAVALADAGGCDVSLSDLVANRVIAFGAPASITAPAWLLLLALATQTASRGGSGPLNTADTDAMCATVSGWVANVTVAMATPSILKTPAAPLQYQFRLQADNIVPSFLLGQSPAVALLTTQTSVGDPRTWPGTPLGALSNATNITACLAAATSSAGSSVLQVYGDVNQAATVTIYAFAIDALGAIGVATTTAGVTPLYAPSLNLVTVSNDARTFLSTRFSPTDPYAAISVAAALASLLGQASTGSASTGNVTTDAIYTAKNAGYRATGIASVLRAITAITESVEPFDTGILIDNGLLTLSLSALKLASNPLELSPGSGLNATVALTTVLRAATPASLAPGNATASTVPAFPDGLGSTALGLLVSTASASYSADAFSGAAHDSLSALTSAMLRATAAGSPGVAVFFPAVAIVAGGTFCGNTSAFALSLTARRLVPATTAASSSVVVSLTQPLAPCPSGTSVTAAQQAPGVTLTPEALAEASAATGGPVDAFVVQWSLPPYAAAGSSSTSLISGDSGSRGGSNISSGNSSSGAGNSSSPRAGSTGRRLQSSLALQQGANALSSRVVSVSLQAPNGTSISVSGLRRPLLISLPLTDPAALDTTPPASPSQTPSPSANGTASPTQTQTRSFLNATLSQTRTPSVTPSSSAQPVGVGSSFTVRAAQTPPLVFNLTCPSQVGG